MAVADVSLSHMQIVKAAIIKRHVLKEAAP